VTNAADRILHDALGLSEKERAEIAARLIESLDAGTGADANEIEEAWAIEIERRCAKLDARTSGTSDWDDVRRKIEADIRRR
jgi:putative addiction module component (TIGR02574 family)